MDSTKEKEEISQDMPLRRLKRIEGQIRGIEKMLVDGRDCESLVTQLAVVRSAIESVGALVLNNYIKFCFVGANLAVSQQPGSTAIMSPVSS